MPRLYDRRPCLLAPSDVKLIPFNSVGTEISAKDYRKGKYNIPVQFNPYACGDTMPCSEQYLNNKFYNESFRELLTRNKGMSNPTNKYPFYDTMDPSTMWTTPNMYANPMS